MFERLLKTKILLLLAAAGCQQQARNLPTCPSGDWCTSPSNASLVASEPGEGGACPTELGWSLSAPDGGTRATDLPADQGHATLDPKATAASGGQCCYSWGEPCPGGRPLRVADRVVVAELGASLGWSTDLELDTDGVDPEAREALLRAWRADALSEHASIASFARAALELMQLGAPADLVGATQRASLDEIEHARLAFGIASRLAGERIAPGALPPSAPRQASLERLAVDTFLEGCVGETVAAVAVCRAASACTHPELRAALLRVAEDEGAHAELAWRTLAWAVREGGARIADVVKRQASSPSERKPRSDALGGELRSRFGRLGPAELAAAERDAWREIIGPALDALTERDPIGVSA